MAKGKVMAVVGGQYGSEGKGVIVNHIKNKFDIHVRTGGPNAGHSFFHDGRVWKMQTVPCGWANKNAMCLIGAGGLLSPENFLKEVCEIATVDNTIRVRLRVDPNCGILEDKFHKEEGGVNGEMHKSIGSTGEGVGTARIARIRRNADGFKLAKHIVPGEFVQDGIDLYDFVSKQPVNEFMVHHIHRGANVLLEGTQGSGLSLVHGPWPFVTSADTNAAQLCADAGLSPLLLTDVLLVVRTYPIRVAGNSGPLKDEISWEEMSKRIGKPVKEKTTVTLKTRRVGEWDWDLLRRSVTLNSPTGIALTFLDYIDPLSEGATKINGISSSSKEFMFKVVEAAKCPINYVGTGGPGWSVIDLTNMRG